MRRSASFYNGAFQLMRQHASAAFVQELEFLAYRLGAAAMRYVKVPTDAIFQHKGVPCQYAIVFTVEMAKDPTETAPSFEAMKEVVKGYKNLAIISNKLTRFLRRHGYGAYPGTAVGGLSDYPHLAELAGLGAIGYHGLLIAPENGARLRINTIYTNIENLPMQEENEHQWVRDFCAMCKKCIRKCPVSAIFEQPQLRGNGGMQCIDHATCRDYFQSHYGCAVCLAVCPFSQVGYAKVRQRFKGNPHAPQYHIPVDAVTISASSATSSESRHTPNDERAVHSSEAGAVSWKR
ncbi:MAG: hypothetical protein MI924_29590 [Chloroflexales bacterium]|nr:hypothetical protein [Chloroflexales bacterium]